MKIFDIYETSLLEELRINISKNFFKVEEKISGVITVLEDYSAHYEIYRNLLNSIYNNWDLIKHKYKSGTNFGDILINELDEELLNRTINRIRQNK